MNKEPLTRYFIDILQAEHPGSACHGCYSYAFSLLHNADTWESYLECLREARKNAKASKAMRSFEAHLFDLVWELLIIVTIDYKRADKGKDE